MTADSPKKSAYERWWQKHWVGVIAFIMLLVGYTTFMWYASEMKNTSKALEIVGLFNLFAMILLASFLMLCVQVTSNKFDVKRWGVITALITIIIAVFSQIASLFVYAMAVQSFFLMPVCIVITLVIVCFAINKK